MHLEGELNRCSVRWLLVLLAAVVLAVVLGLAGPAAGQTLDPAEPDRVDEPDGASVATPPTGGRTTVLINVYVDEILGIDERENTFEVLARIEAQWDDKRSEPPNCDDSTPTVYDGEGATERLKVDLWSPGFYVVNARAPRETSAVALTVNCAGRVFYEEQFVATVVQRLSGLNDFPYDEHVIAFAIAPFAKAEKNAIAFAPLNDLGPGDARVADRWDSEEWDFSPNSAEPRFDPETPKITTAIQIDRKWKYYWWNIIGPLLLFVLIAWSVFWLGDNIGERLAVSITILLTVVAFDFVTSDDLPRLSYTTRLDAFYNVSYLAIASTVVLSIIATRQYRTGVEKNGSKQTPMLDVVSRVVFPYLYFVAVLMALTGMFSPGDSGTADSEPDERPEAIDVDDDEQPDRVVELSLDAPVSGRIAVGGAFDSYRFCAAEDGGRETLSVRMKRTGAESDVLDPYLEVFTEDGQFVTADDDSAGGLDSLAMVEVEPGDCYLILASDFDQLAGDYEITATAGDFEPDPIDIDLDDLDPVDAGDLLDQADQLSLDAPVSGRIAVGGAFDSYEFCAAEDGGRETLSVRVKRTGAESDVLDPYLEVFTEDGQFVTADDDSAGGLDSLAMVEVEPGDCYLILASGFDQSAGDYEITATFDEIDLSDLEAD